MSKWNPNQSSLVQAHKAFGKCRCRLCRTMDKIWQNTQTMIEKDGKTSRKIQHLNAASKRRKRYGTGAGGTLQSETKQFQQRQRLRVISCHIVSYRVTWNFGASWGIKIVNVPLSNLSHWSLYARLPLGWHQGDLKQFQNHVVLLAIILLICILCIFLVKNCIQFKQT